MKLYCDMNVYNRCFDDQSQLRIRLETTAIEGIFELAERRSLELFWLFMLEYENSLNPHEERKEWAALLSGLCVSTIGPSPRILTTARGLTKSVELTPRDALHVACAEIGECDFFVTCDDDLIRMVHKGKQGPRLKVKTLNPVEFIRSRE